MDRRRFVALIGGALAAPLASAQQPGRKYRVGAMFPMGAAAMQPYRSALSERLAKHGFVEGRNFDIDARSAVESLGVDRDVARELLAAKPDAIFTCLSRVTEAAQAATKTVPIVFAWVADPVTSGIVKAYAKPGGNTTGVSNRFGELLVKRLELARELLPGMKRIAVVGGVHGPLYEAISPGLRKAAADLGVVLLETPVFGDWVAAIDAAVKNGAEAALHFHLYALQPVSGALIIQYASQKRFLVVFADAEAVENGGLIAYGTNLVDDVWRGADLLARVLRGDKPAALPVDQAARFEMVVNLKTAKALGLKIPPSLLLRADRVIE